MTELMKQEMQEIFYLFFAGLGVMLLFSLRDQISRFFSAQGRCYRFVYLSFWVAAAYLFYQFAYKGAYGVVSWYSLLAFALGILLWKKVFCDIIILYDTVQKQIGDLEHEKKDKRTHSAIRRKKSNRRKPGSGKTGTG